jgi:hypothetical protein
MVAAKLYQIQYLVAENHTSGGQTIPVPLTILVAAKPYHLHFWWQSNQTLTLLVVAKPYHLHIWWRSNQTLTLLVVAKPYHLHIWWRSNHTIYTTVLMSAKP